MDSLAPLVIPLEHHGECKSELVGAKAANLASLLATGFRVPAGFCLTAEAYRRALESSDIGSVIHMELGRKPLEDMRWEEIWDTALRIRAAFVAHDFEPELTSSLRDAAAALAWPLAVRSSAPGEDSATRSFAGLHDSVTGVQSEEELLDAVRVVWSSLWSDAALLYRQELGLDPSTSSMAVLVQEMVDGDRSGVAFARDPRDPDEPYALVEAVPGPCSQLVDGEVDPDRWELVRPTAEIRRWSPGDRGDPEQAPLLDRAALAAILDTVLAIEARQGWTPDVEWIGGSAPLTVLQARPITSGAEEQDDERRWYLSLRPGDARLRELRDRVSGELIPQLQGDGERLARESLEGLDDEALALSLDERLALLERWKEIYRDDFIPFAHGVRRLATYYNDAVKPTDPYEFVGLLEDEPMIAARRNDALEELARRLASHPPLREALSALVDRGELDTSVPARLKTLEGGPAFLEALEGTREAFLDITYGDSRLGDDVRPLLRTLLELSSSVQLPARRRDEIDRREHLEHRLLEAVGADRRDEASEFIETGRLSWRLRDDDNLLVSRLESQVIRAAAIGVRRLKASGQVSEGVEASIELGSSVADALRDPSRTISADRPEPVSRSDDTKASSPETPRQLIGQPASPGLATGSVRRVANADDLGRFRRGDILVCDAIQPTMTHIVPLAAAIIERRGGMLIHGAIIAREFQIPCVNGVRDAAGLLENGDLVTVDGHLGIVTVGPPDFGLELELPLAQGRRPAAERGRYAAVRRSGGAGSLR